MTPTEFWLNLLAIIAGPVLAVQAQKRIEHYREARNRKLWLFRELMATRGTRLSPRHVEALNLVELEYSPDKRKQRPVHEAWRSYFDTLNTPLPDERNPQPHYQRRDDAFVALLYQMGTFLGFAIDRVAISRNVYTPTGHGEVEKEINIIRKSLAKIFTTGQHAIRVHVVGAENAPALPPVMTEEEFYQPIILHRRRD